MVGGGFSMEGQSEEDRRVFRIGGFAAVVGALLGMVGNLIHPVTPIGDIEGVARVIAESDIWVPVHLVIVLGIVLMLGGLVAIGHSIRGGLAGALARFGYAAAVLGAAIGLILVILDGVAARQLAEEWASASTESRDIALGLVHANETINFALASLFNFVLVAGTIQASVGEPTDASRVLTISGPTIITLWLLVMGVLVLRKAGAVPVRSVGVEAGGGAGAANCSCPKTPARPRGSC